MVVAERRKLFMERYGLCVEFENFVGKEGKLGYKFWGNSLD